MTIFGQLTSTVLGIYVVFKLTQYVFNVVCNGFALFRVFGWSWALLCSLGSALSNALLQVYEYQLITKPTPEVEDPLTLENPRPSTSRQDQGHEIVEAREVPGRSRSLYPSLGEQGEVSV